MSKYIKNSDIISHTWRGKTFQPSEYRMINVSDEIYWANDSKIIAAIGSGIAIVAKTDDGLSDMLDVSDGLNFLKGELNLDVINAPFASKLTTDGKKLYRRKHGANGAILASSNSNIDLLVPYVSAKIDKIEIVGGNIGDYLDLVILDTTDGIIQQSKGVPLANIVPNLQLNQFGFSVNVAKDFYEDQSNYDADLIQNMIVRVVYYNQGISTVNIGLNVVLHEVV